MKKSSYLLTSTLIFKISSVLSAIWAIVSFVIYLFKDIPFDWNSIILFISFALLGIVSLLLYLFFSIKEKAEVQKLKRANPKSRFHMKMEEMENLQSIKHTK